jgi:hypothetical protein
VVDMGDDAEISYMWHKIVENHRFLKNNDNLIILLFLY